MSQAVGAAVAGSSDLPTDHMAAHEARSYWDARHAEEGALRSGGNIGLSEEANQLLYALRVGRLIEATGYESSVTTPLQVLDGGCGKGYFSRALASFGHTVHGIDTSPTAVAECRRLAGPRETYDVSSLAEWAPPCLYDVVLCVDVLFHLLEDVEWEASIRNVATLVRTGGRLLLVDLDAPTDRLWARHQRSRGRGRYEALLATLGLRYVRFLPNGMPGSDVGTHVATRTA